MDCIDIIELLIILVSSADLMGFEAEGQRYGNEQEITQKADHLFSG